MNAWEWDPARLPRRHPTVRLGELTRRNPHLGEFLGLELPRESAAWALRPTPAVRENRTRLWPVRAARGRRGPDGR